MIWHSSRFFCSALAVFLVESLVNFEHWCQGRRYPSSLLGNILFPSPRHLGQIWFHPNFWKCSPSLTWFNVVFCAFHRTLHKTAENRNVHKYAEKVCNVYTFCKPETAVQVRCTRATAWSSSGRGISSTSAMSTRRKSRKTSGSHQTTMSKMVCCAEKTGICDTIPKIVFQRASAVMSSVLNFTDFCILPPTWRGVSRS